VEKECNGQLQEGEGLILGEKEIKTKKTGEVL